MTGRNLHAEAGSGKGVGGGCHTQKKGSEKGAEVPFSLEKESGVTLLGFQKRRSGSNDGSSQSLGPSGRGG